MKIRRTRPSEIPMSFSSGRPWPPPISHHCRKQAAMRTIAPTATTRRPRPAVLEFIGRPLRLVGLGAKDAHEAQVTVYLSVVETIPHHEGVRDLKPHVVEGNRHQTSGRLCEQRAQSRRA